MLNYRGWVLQAKILKIGGGGSEFKFDLLTVKQKREKEQALSLQQDLQPNTNFNDFFNLSADAFYIKIHVIGIF